MNTEELLLQILQKLDELDERLKKVEQSANNMDSHIGFVKDIYQQIQVPFQSMIEWFEPGNLLTNE